MAAAATDILKGKTILIVDDEPALCEPLCYEFESLGCKVFSAGNGRDALAIVRREKIDAVISDVRMPGGDGIELLKGVKSLHHEFPIVMLITGFADLSREDAYDFGADAILSKPFDLDELDEAVVRILTPREKRWDQPSVPKSAGAKARQLIERHFASLDDAAMKGELRLGRGGFFLQMASAPSMNEHVSISIHFARGDVLEIQGSGVVRWVRREDRSSLPQGCGIEFESLNPEAREKIVRLTEALKLKAFIPKA